MFEEILYLIKLFSFTFLAIEAEAMKKPKNEMLKYRDEIFSD